LVETHKTTILKWQKAEKFQNGKRPKKKEEFSAAHLVHPSLAVSVLLLVGTNQSAGFHPLSSVFLLVSTNQSAGFHPPSSVLSLVWTINPLVIIHHHLALSSKHFWFDYTCGLACFHPPSVLSLVCTNQSTGFHPPSSGIIFKTFLV